MSQLPMEQGSQNILAVSAGTKYCLYSGEHLAVFPQQQQKPTPAEGKVCSSVQ